MVEFVIPGKPLVWKAPYVGSRGAYSIRTPILGQIKAILRGQFDSLPMRGLVAIDFVFYLPIPKATSRARHALMMQGLIRPEGNGDVTNFRKFYEDALQDIVIENDRTVVDGRSAKLYGNPARTEVYVYPLAEYLQKFGPLPR